jgi:trehalose 6-phosphate synthase/phosphatase
MGKLFLVSNRLPLIIEKRKEGLLFSQSAGGLVTGLSAFHGDKNSRWVGWSGIPVENISPAEEGKIKEDLKSKFRCYPVNLARDDIEGYYHGFCNKTIWPLFHNFIETSVYNRNFYESYRRVNTIFCRELKKIIRPDDTIWVHDYHLMLLPALLRQEFPRASIGFFLHIPFPPLEIFSLLPWRKEILRGLLGADLIGFHTFDYVHNFLESVRRLLDYEHSLGRITCKDRTIKADIFPMGIDVDRFANASMNAEVQKAIKKFRNRIGDRKVILSIDRLDYTKGILSRLEAYDYFLEKNPAYREKVVLILVAVPSRSRVSQYVLLKKQVDEYVGRINGKYGTIGWMPISYLYRFLPFPFLAALYYLGHINLVTPLRDGMNLIAKEYVAAKVDGQGVLILSEQAGAVHELGEALIVNPNSREEIADALKKALEMPEEEQQERFFAMQARLRRYDVRKWANDFINRLNQTKNVQRELCAVLLPPDRKDKLRRDYFRAKKRLILLDYDGTLVPFAEKSEKAAPDRELLEILEKLTQRRENEVAVISSRDKKTLEAWLGNLDVILAAEHGAWLRKKRGAWRMIKPLRNDWKEEIRPVFEIFVDRTPGSFIEEKEYSLVWHFRKVSPELASIRAGELKDALLHLASNLDLGVLQGNKVIEVKNIGINKGLAAQRLLEKKALDFVLAMGDDWSDEDLFAALPDFAYTIRVGLAPSRAKYHLDSFMEARGLLKELERTKND